MFLKNFKKDINEKMLDALRSEDVESVRKYINLGANVNHHFHKLNSCTLLHFCCTSVMIEELLKLGADIDARDHYGSTPLHLCMFPGTSNLALELIRMRADVNAKNYCGQTPLHLAIINNVEFPVVHELLKSGADVNSMDQFCNSPLNYAVSHSTNLDVSKALLEYGGNIRVMTDFSLNLGPLEEALMWKNMDHFELFIKFTVLKHDDFASILCLDSFTGYSYYNRMLNFIDDCWSEVKDLKQEKIGTKSLYDIMVGKVVHIKPFSLINKSENYFRLKYSLYSDFILDKLQGWLERASLLRSLEFILDSNVFCFNLNHDCFYEIVELLANHDLVNLIEALNIWIE